MKILVIFTGGTIGCQREDEWLSLNTSTKSVLISNYIEKCGISVEFETITPCQMLSENLSAKELNIIIKTVRENITKNYDGIIITHGTDSLQYTAVAVAYAFSDSKVPICLVSSNYPLGDNRANGDENFEAAVAFIKDRKNVGVFVAYKNTGEDKTFIHWGTKLLLHRETCDSLKSINDEFYATYHDGKITLNDKFKICGELKSLSDLEFCENPKILTVYAHPGDDFSYDVEKYNAVILMPYHSGTLNTENANFVSFCKKTEKMNVPVFVVNLASGFEYESKKTFDNLGLIELPFCAFASAYMKLWCGISKGKSIDEFMLKPMAGEFCEI